MDLLINLFYLIVFCGTINATSLKCSKYKINNGKVRMKPNSKFARFYCNKGYMLIGSKYSGCFNGYFDTVPPICVQNRPNCKKIPGLLNGLIIPEANNAVVHFFCRPEHALIGANVTICDGDKWLYQLPYCRRNGTEPSMKCDFETEDLCGWSHDLNHNFDWRRTNSRTPSVRTGPQFDHTGGVLRNGHYMYVESTNRLVNDTARLISPVFPGMPLICVRFYYHMYGIDMGTLNVYIKRENERFDGLRPRFSVAGNQGDLWHAGWIYLENGTEASFQVIFEGLRGASYLSDIAIDDVSVEADACPEEAPQTTDYSTETSEIPVFDTCFNRCGENTTNPANISCSCDENCFDLGSCCADFIQYCVLETGTSSIDYEDVVESTAETSSETIDATTESTTIPVVTTTIPTVSGTIPTLITTKQPVKLTFAQPNLKISTKTTTTTKEPVINAIKTLKTAKTTQTTPKTTPVTTSFPVLPDTTTSPPALHVETDFLVTQEPESLQQNTKKAPESNDLFIYLTVFVSSAFATVFLSLLTVFLKRNNITCKKFTASRNNDSMSDVRFLATDEVLDFTWKRAESL